MLELGKPAEWAAEQRVKRAVGGLKLYAQAAIISIIALAGIIASAIYIENKTVLLIVVLVLILAIVFLVPKPIIEGAALMKRSGQAKIGVESEKNTRKYIKKGKPHVVAYGLKPTKKGGDIDVCLITQPGVVLAVEVKTGFGKVSLNGDSVRAGRRIIPGSPLNQAERNAEKLARAMGLSDHDVIPVVCIPGMNNSGFWVNRRTLVCSPKQLFSMGNAGGEVVYPDRKAAEEAMKAVWRNST